MLKKMKYGQPKQKSYKRKCHKNKKILFKHNKQIKKFYLAESIFFKWLDKNIDRFAVKPIKRTTNSFYFEGVIKNVYLQMDFMTPEAMMCFDDEEGEYFDHQPIEYIGNEQYDPQKGFYDADRIDNIYTYFPTREELYINEVFEEIITYCNKKIVPENSVYLADLAGVTTGLIAPSDETDNKDLNRYFGASIKLRNGLVGCDGEKLFPDVKPFKCIKYDLFDETGKPSVCYLK